jgi:hypothetical protein
MNSNAQAQIEQSTFVIAESIRRFDVEYSFVCLDYSTENWISHAAISPCFATFEQAREAQELAKIQYPECCIIKGTTRYYRSENDRDRQELLAKIVTDAWTVNAGYKNAKNQA